MTIAAPALPVTTERLVLRAYRLDDVGATLAYYQDPDVARFLLTGPLDRAGAEEAVRFRCTRTSPSAPDEGLSLAVEHQGQIVGDLVLNLRGEKLSIGEIGWVFNPTYGGQGFATESAKALIDLAFEHYRFHRVIAQLDARNGPSARLCERLGMTREGHLRKDWWSKGEWTDTLVYGLLAEELPAASS